MTSGLSGTDCFGTDCFGTDCFGTDCFGTDWVGTDWVGTDWVGTDRVGTDRVGTDRVGTDCFGTDCFGTNCFGTDQKVVINPGLGDPWTGYWVGQCLKWDRLWVFMRGEMTGNGCAGRRDPRSDSESDVS